MKLNVVGYRYKNMVVVTINYELLTKGLGETMANDEVR